MTRACFAPDKDSGVIGKYISGTPNDGNVRMWIAFHAQRVLIVIDSGSIDSMSPEGKINRPDQLSSDLRYYKARGERSRRSLLQQCSF